MNKRFVTLLGTSLLVVAAAANADGGVSANVGLTTDYVFRGVSQTNEAPAIQGGFDYNDPSGLYVGTWESNIAFAGSLESDWYFGYNGKVNDDLGYSVGYIYYYYPKQSTFVPSSNVSFGEVNAGVSFKGFSAGISYSNNFSFDTGKATYYNVAYDLGLPNDFGLNFHYGYQAIDDNAAWGTPDYSDYSIGLSKSYGGFDFGLTWYDTNLSKSECFGGTDLCKSRVTFNVGKSL